MSWQHFSLKPFHSNYVVRSQSEKFSRSLDGNAESCSCGANLVVHLCTGCLLLAFPLAAFHGYILLSIRVEEQEEDGSKMVEDGTCGTCAYSTRNNYAFTFFWLWMGFLQYEYVCLCVIIFFSFELHITSTKWDVQYAVKFWVKCSGYKCDRFQQCEISEFKRRFLWRIFKNYYLLDFPVNKSHSQQQSNK